MLEYKSLIKQSHKLGSYSIVPIRYEDRIPIMNWRNDQTYHLRQTKKLNIKGQEKYFKKVINNLFKEDKPDQILFSLLENQKCIGYGGLVHINWIDKNAELSFLMNTSLEEKFFDVLWKTFLELIERVAFEDLNLHKIFTFAYDLRPNLYNVLEKCNYNKEATLNEHFFYQNRFKDVIIHSKINDYLSYRKASLEDVKKYFYWFNDKQTRESSYNSNTVDFQNHKKWFKSKLKDKQYTFLIFKINDSENIAQLRFKKENNNDSTISISIDPNHRNKNYSSKIIRIGTDFFLKNNPNYTVNAFIKVENIRSQKAFKKAGFEIYKTLKHKGFESFQYIKSGHENRKV